MDQSQQKTTKQPKVPALLRKLADWFENYEAWYNEQLKTAKTDSGENPTPPPPPPPGFDDNGD